MVKAFVTFSDFLNDYKYIKFRQDNLYALFYKVFSTIINHFCNTLQPPNKTKKTVFFLNKLKKIKGGVIKILDKDRIVS